MDQSNFTTFFFCVGYETNAVILLKTGTAGLWQGCHVIYVTSPQDAANAAVLLSAWSVGHVIWGRGQPSELWIWLISPLFQVHCNFEQSLRD